MSHTLTGNIMANSEIRTKLSVNTNLAEPPMFKIIYMNDEVTTMEFVVGSLIEFFNYNEDTAMNITTGIHQAGSAVVAILPYEIAEQKGIEVTISARAQGYPLQIKIEAENT